MQLSNAGYQVHISSANFLSLFSTVSMLPFATIINITNINGW